MGCVLVVRAGVVNVVRAWVSVGAGVVKSSNGSISLLPTESTLMPHELHHLHYILHPAVTTSDIRLIFFCPLLSLFVCSLFLVSIVTIF